MGIRRRIIMDWHGFTHTGVNPLLSNVVLVQTKAQVLSNSFYSMPGLLHYVCHEIRKFRCDHTLRRDDRATGIYEALKVGLTNMKDEDHSCFREWYEASYACADNITDFDGTSSYAKKAQDFCKTVSTRNECSPPFMILHQNQKELIYY